MYDYNQLHQTVIKNSVANNWEDAVGEWKVIGMDEDENADGQCICGKESLRYLFKIQNIKNGNILYPIGSSCIKKFGVTEMDRQADALSQWSKFVMSIRRGDYITLDQMSRRLIDLLQAYGYVNQADHDFLMDMFNRRREMTPKQKKKFNCLILFDIKNPILKQYGQIKPE